MTEPLLPLFVLSGIFILGLPLYAWRTRKRGPSADDRIETRRTGPFLGRWLMYYGLWVIGPLERLLVRTGVSPNLITFSSLLVSFGAGVALAEGRFGLGGWLYLFTGILDIFDGRVARATGRVSKGGAFYDSIVDRWAEALIFGGLAWYYKNSWVLLLVLGALAASFMVSYARARGESLGAKTADVGAMQRPERILYLGVGLALSPIAVALLRFRSLPVIALGLVAATSLWTSIRRSFTIYKQLDEPAPATEKPAEEPAEDLVTQI